MHHRAPVARRCFQRTGARDPFSPAPLRSPSPFRQRLGTRPFLEHLQVRRCGREQAPTPGAAREEERLFEWNAEGSQGIEDISAGRSDALVSQLEKDRSPAPDGHSADPSA